MSSDTPETDLTDSLVTEFKLDPASSSHLYLQVRNGLARMIRERRFSVDDAMPPERVLVERLGQVHRPDAGTAANATALGRPTGDSARPGEDGCTVEITHTWCRSDYYDFVAELRC